MVTVIFKRNLDCLVSFKAKGHAESVDEGYDLVCCAVSSITIAIANGITEVLSLKAKVKENDGFLSVDLRVLSKEQIKEAQVLMKTLFLSMESLEKSYGEYIKIEIEEV